MKMVLGLGNLLREKVLTTPSVPLSRTTGTADVSANVFVSCLPFGPAVTSVSVTTQFWYSPLIVLACNGTERSGG